MGINSLGNSYSSPSSSSTNKSASVIRQSVSTYNTKTVTNATTASNNSAVVSISDSAKAAQSTELTFKEVGMAARTKLDALKQQAAEKTGTTANLINVQAPGVIDFSSFSDQELAAMDLNSSGNFSQAERDVAGGELNERLRVSLESYRGATNAGDRRGQAMAIDALYSQMTPEVRSALGWTPAMMASNDKMLEGDESLFGKLDFSEVQANLRTAQANGGLTFSG